MRNTYYSLLSRVYTLNDVLNRPVQQYESRPDDKPTYSVGHIRLSHDSNGYHLEEQISESGGTNSIASCLTAHDTDLLLTGIMRGITLRHEQTLQRKD